ncbi:MAG: bifunctional oligoribonuclease/PAP phosphatase NrnA [candidate division Zixibacteria bacterium]|nr:bifunctional oligoribonuclease/PAP phosphatase NrnA [candidate division Zixibacteria bacterium]
MSTKIQKTYNDIQKAVADSRSVLIFSHSAPDGDSIGSQLAFQNYILDCGKDVVIINDGAFPGLYKNLPDIEVIRDINNYSIKEVEKKPDLIVVLDCSNLERLAKAQELIIDNIPIINIDHHPDNSEFGNINIVNSSSSSTSEILTEYFLGIDHTIDRKTASLLYTGILTDTGRFRFESTSRRTMELVGVLIERGANPRKICDDIYYSIPPSILKMTGKMLEDAEFYENGKICLMELNKENIKKHNASFGDFDGLAEYTLHTENALVGALLKELEDKNIKVSLRSKGNINVSKVAHIYGGGGHRNASGFVMKSSQKESRKKLLDNLKGLVDASV